MSEDRYRVLRDAINTARYSMTAGGEPGPDWVGEVRHLETLQEILDRHKPAPQRGNTCHGCDVGKPTVATRYWSECPEAATVEAALRKMGALE